jgi:hypothetical protein
VASIVRFRGSGRFFCPAHGHPSAAKGLGDMRPTC